MEETTYMIISVDEKNLLEIKTKGPRRRLLALLGGLNIAEEWIRKQYTLNASIGDTLETPPENACAKTDTSYNHCEEQRVGKQDALNHYIELREMLEKRMTSIAKSDQDATFLINPHHSDLL